jgi:hypothetical protein
MKGIKPYLFLSLFFFLFIRQETVNIYIQMLNEEPLLPDILVKVKLKEKKDEINLILLLDKCMDYWRIWVFKYDCWI